MRRGIFLMAHTVLMTLFILGSVGLHFLLPWKPVQATGRNSVGVAVTADFEDPLQRPNRVMAQRPIATLEMERESRAGDPVAHSTHVLASRGGENPANATWFSFRATWYSPVDGPGQGTVTATGSHVKDAWTIAVDPRVIPLGSIVEVRFSNGSLHTYRAEDTGGAIRGNHIDIYDTSHLDCVRNGVQKIMLRIVRIGH